MKEPRIYFFDMDHTLQDNDSDVSWKQFLISEAIAPADAMKEADFFYEQYKRGELDVKAFLSFQLREFIGRTPAEMLPLVRRHFEMFSRNRIYPEGKMLVDQVIGKGKPAILLTATNRFISAPFAAYLKMTDVLANDLELDSSGRFTGRTLGEYSAGGGKVFYAEEYCRRHGMTLSEAAYYGDSIVDRYLLEAVGFPFAVNPSPQLRQLAVERNWTIIDFRRV